MYTRVAEVIQVCSAGASHRSAAMQEVDSSVLAQASMRAMGRYELGWLQALVTQDTPDQVPKLAFAPPRDDDEGTEGGIFIGGSPIPLLVG